MVHAPISLILMVCLGAQRSPRDCVRGDVRACRRTQLREGRDIPSLCGLPFQRTALHTIVHLPRRRDAGYPRRRPARVYLHDRFHRASPRKRRPRCAFSPRRGDIEFSSHDERSTWKHRVSKKTGSIFFETALPSLQAINARGYARGEEDIMCNGKEGMKGSRKLCIFRKKDFGRIMNNG